MRSPITCGRWTTAAYHLLQADVDDEDSRDDDEGHDGGRVYDTADPGVLGGQLPVFGQLDADLVDDVSDRERERGLQDRDHAGERAPPQVPGRRPPAEVPRGAARAGV